MVWHVPGVLRPSRMVVHKRVVGVGDPERGGRVVALSGGGAGDEFVGRSLRKLHGSFLSVT